MQNDQRHVNMAGVEETHQIPRKAQTTHTSNLDPIQSKRYCEHHSIADKLSRHDLKEALLEAKADIVNLGRRSTAV